jgi:hypothetical protein
MHIPDSSRPPQNQHISVFHGTYNYLNNIIQCLVEDYNEVFTEEGQGAEVMHKMMEKGGQQAHLFYKSTTGDPLFGILHETDKKPYLYI